PKALVLEQFEELTDRAWALQRSDPHTMAQLGKQALDSLPHESLSDEENGLRMAESLRVMGRGNTLARKFPEAVNQTQKSLALFQTFGDRESALVALNTLATAYSAMSLHEPALQSFYEILNDGKGPKQVLANASMNIAGVYAKIGHMDRALQHFHDGVRAFEDEKQFSHLSMALSNLSAVYYELDENSKAESTARQSLALVEKHSLDTSYFLHAACNLVATYLRLDRYDEALILADEARRKLQTENNCWTELTLNVDFAEYYVRIDKVEDAKILLTQSLKLNPESSQECKIHKLLSSIYKSQKQFEKALFHFETYHTLHESLFNEESDRRARNLESQHRLDKIQRELEQVRAQNSELLEQVQANSAHLRDVTHDVNSPLGAILGFTELLKDDPDLNHKHQNFIDAINKSGQYILALTKNLLQSSVKHSDNEPPELQLSLWERTLSDITEPLVIEAQLKSLTIEVINKVPRSFQFLSDFQKLQRILHNLIGNAIKFTQQGQITVTSKLSDDFHALVVQIADTGPGIHEDILDTLFEPFQQGPRAQESGTGSGLGLAICRQFTEDLGGSISVESKAGSGSLFILQLPIESPQTLKKD
ncbi:MAG: ATP-binding protein, partial [Planctomycetota bacterium]|nr:ATP-binding protein [Planctomycetota bacterium]